MFKVVYSRQGYHTHGSLFEDLCDAFFQLVNPVLMNADSAFNDDCSFFCALALIHVKQSTESSPSR